MVDTDGVLIAIASAVIAWVFIVASMPAWHDPAVLFWSAVALVCTGGVAVLDEQMSASE